MLGFFVPAWVIGPQSVIRVEAESGVMAGTRVSQDRIGYSGTGYVTGFVANGAHVTLHVRAKAGLYHVRLGYSTPSGPKGFGIRINGIETSGMLEDIGSRFGSHDAGKAELRDGDNEVVIQRGWGYWDCDYIEFSTAKPPHSLRTLGAAPVDREAFAPARSLLKRLVSSYGKATLSGQYNEEDSATIERVTGQTPAIYGGDLIDYSPSRTERGANPGQTVEKMIARAKAGQIVTVSWHWNAPSHLIDMALKGPNGEIDAHWYKGFYSNATTFDFAAALDHPESAEYQETLRDLDAIALQLKKFQKAGVAVLWRPLHEAEGKWFWWGAKGAGPFKRLWRLMFERFTQVQGLHNLLWVYSSGTDPAWYPGDDVVDVVGIDAYPADPRDPLSELWDRLLASFDGRKLLAISEFGKVPDVARMQRFGIRWSYFVSWPSDLAHSVPAETLRRLYDRSVVSNAPAKRQ